MTTTEIHPDPTCAPAPLGLVMSGGGARAAYQAGLLQGLAAERPSATFPIITGVSAGAINASFLAQADGDLAERAARLVDLWCGIEVNDVIDAKGVGLWRTFASFGLRLASGGRIGKRERQSLVSTQPLAEFLTNHLRTDADGELPGIERRIRSGDLQAVAVTGSCYSNGASVTWIQGSSIDNWERPKRLSVPTKLRVDHILASSSLPLMFPPVRVDGAWYGDGGIRLTAPLAPAIHLGASRILAVSTRHAGGHNKKLPRTEIVSPPPAQVAGSLLNAIFLDLLDSDALNLARINTLLEHVPASQRAGLRRIDLAVVRPSHDLGKLANDYEARLPRGLRFLTRGWGTKDVGTNDLLSLIMFQRDYLERLVQLGRHDAERLAPQIVPFLDGESLEDCGRRLA